MASFQDVSIQEMQQVEGGESGLGTVAVVAACAISLAAPELAWVGFLF